MDNIKKRIQSLLAKTTENGCTEEEAISASKAVKKLLDKYNLSLTDIKIKEITCEQHTIKTRKSGKPAKYETRLSAVIAEFIGCETWHNNAGEITAFGIPEDVEAFKGMYQMLDAAIKRKYIAFQATRDYEWARRRASNHVVKNSYTVGFVTEICRRLREIKRKEEEANPQTVGSALIVVKQDKIKNDMEELGIQLTAARKSRISVVEAARASGVADGKILNLNGEIR